MNSAIDENASIEFIYFENSFSLIVLEKKNSIFIQFFKQ